MDCSPTYSSAHGILQAEYWSGLAFASSEDLLSPGIKPGSPALQADSLWSEPLGKPHNTYEHLINIHRLNKGVLSDTMEVTKVRKACFFLSRGSSLMGDRDTVTVNKMGSLCESPELTPT